MAIRERVYGKSHHDVANVLVDLGSVYCELGDFAKARKVHDRALVIKRRVYGKDHKYYLDSLKIVGNIKDRIARCKKTTSAMKKKV